jgi:hypothetical protein
VATGVATVAEYVKDELAAQDARKSSIEQRSVAVITTSGGLVTLLFALGALSTRRSDHFQLGGHAPTYLGVALILFVLAAVAALVANVPVRYSVMAVEGLRRELMMAPSRTVDHALARLTDARLYGLASARDKNRRKAKLLFAAITLEVVAVGFTSAAIWVLIGP